MTTIDTLLTEADSATLARRLNELSDQIAERGLRYSADAETDEFDALLDEQRRLSRLYVGLIPPRSISRDPFTAQQLFRAIDPSLAGRWWDHHSPLRVPRADPATMYALTGALALASEPESTLHLVAPGPTVPYVVPRLLEAAGTVAVLSSVSVGEHRAYITAYYAAPEFGPDGTARIRELPIANEWPYDRWVGPNGWREVYADEEIDVDVGRWLDDQRLLWIAPDDDRAILRDGRGGGDEGGDCPYLDLEGASAPQRIQAGMTW